MPHEGGHMTNMSNHPQTHRAEPTERPVPDAWHRTTATTRQAGQQETRNTRSKTAGPPKCKLRASLGTCTPHRQMNRNPQGQPGSQADPVMYHPAHHHAQGKDTSPASRRAAHKGHSTQSKEVALPPETQNHQHPCQSSKNDKAKAVCGSP
ncbi:hypothetical protein CRENBAI_009805 [Crenichthys baileyi]|uniref:Uncharacterized protein n=1 Tax=Crenichthys baileyi TaxID=28760 RepID=A0AAV9SLA8_9TELE